jgi:hypothetical protein
VIVDDLDVVDVEDGFGRYGLKGSGGHLNLPTLSPMRERVANGISREREVTERTRSSPDLLCRSPSPAKGRGF